FHLPLSSCVLHPSHMILFLLFFFSCYHAHRDLHSFPTRRSSDLDETRTLTIDPADYALNPDSGEYRIVKAFRYHDDMKVFWLTRSEEHTSELQSRFDLVCRLLLEKKKKKQKHITKIKLI